jgi:glycosyltransferase involved in cell wall biosynthesis
MKERKSILLFADWYEPGYRAGGPIRSCVNFARHMSTDYRVYVFTSDRDLGSTLPYEGVPVDTWQTGKDGTAIYYCSPGNLSWQNIRRQLAAVRPDFVYLNSMFSPKFTIYPLLISRIYRHAYGVVLSPRGMLRESAIQFKTFKKKVYLTILRTAGMHRAIRFHATDRKEAEDIHKYFGETAGVTIVANFPGAAEGDLGVPVKKEGELSMIFVGRIHPIKNLDLLLETLKQLRISCRLTVVGSLEDRSYWEKCSRIMDELPSNIIVNYIGEVANHELPAITARHHIFVLPTRGENFGHAIFEALAAGRPVLISDQTPWRNLQAAGAGWDLSLDSPWRFGEVIGQAAALGQQEYEALCRSTRQYLEKYVASLNLKEEYQKLFS